jgi:hypothetical protein
MDRWSIRRLGRFHGRQEWPTFLGQFHIVRPTDLAVLVGFAAELFE